MARPIPALPAEAFEITLQEESSICEYRDLKWLGALVVSGNERAPVSGRDPSAPEGGVHIPYDSTGCVMLHIDGDSLRGLHQLQHNLVLASMYVALHESLSQKKWVVGVTHRQLANMVTRLTHFSSMETYGDVRPGYMKRLREAYDDLALSKGEPLEIAMVYMPTQAFIETYAGARAVEDSAASHTYPRIERYK
jgi:hypothetical protein